MARKPARILHSRVDTTLINELEHLLEQLQQAEEIERHPLAHRLAPVLRERYGDLAEAPLSSLIIQGLSRLWRDVAGSVPLALAHRKLLEKYFTLMVCYFYPAQHGLHRFLISSDRLIGPIQSFTDPAARMGEREYLALIYANGDVQRARQALEQHGEVFTALSETGADGLVVHPHPNTVNSRRKAGIKLLTARVAELLRKAEGDFTRDVDSTPNNMPDVHRRHSHNSESNVAAANPTTHAAERMVENNQPTASLVDSMGNVPVSAVVQDTIFSKGFADDAARASQTFAERFENAARQGQPAGVLWRLVDETLETAETPARVEQAHRLAQQLAAIWLGIEPTPERTRALAPMNVRLALRRVHNRLDETEAGSTLMDQLTTAGILTGRGESCRFSSAGVAEWFGAEFIATYHGHRFLPQPRFRRVRRWAAEMLAERGDDARNAILVEDMAHALPGLHPVSVLDVAEILQVFGQRETPSVARFRELITPELRRLAAIRSGRLHQSLKLLEPVFGTALASDSYEEESILPDDVLERARTAMDVHDLIATLSLPDALAHQADWYETRQAIEALIAQVQSPRDLNLALVCAAWLRSASLTQTLEISVGLTWPVVEKVAAVDVLIGLSRDARSPWTRQLALSALANDAHLELVLNTDSPAALATAMTLLLPTNRRAVWDTRAERWKLMNEKDSGE